MGQQGVDEPGPARVAPRPLRAQERLQVVQHDQHDGVAAEPVGGFEREGAGHGNSS